MKAIAPYIFTIFAAFFALGYASLGDTKTQYELEKKMYEMYDLKVTCADILTKECQR